MRRRLFCNGLAAISAAVALPLRAQVARVFRVAWVSVERKNSPAPNFEAFRAGMRDLGYIEGRNLLIDAWWGEGSEDKVGRLADDILRAHLLPGRDLLLPCEVVQLALQKHLFRQQAITLCLQRLHLHVALLLLLCVQPLNRREFAFALAARLVELGP